MEKQRRLVQPPVDGDLLRQAQALQIAGDQNPQSTYGSHAPGSFDLNADMAAVANMANECGVPQSLQSAEDISIKASTPIQTKVNHTEDQQTGEEEEEMSLSSDPIKRSEQFAKILATVAPNAQNIPNAETLRYWKQVHGGIFVTQVEDLVFVYRFIKRQEDIQMRANPQLSAMTQAQIDEMLFDRCVLWPKFTQVEKAMLPCGAIGMVNDQIKLRSLYLDPQYVASITLKL